MSKKYVITGYRYRDIDSAQLNGGEPTFLGDDGMQVSDGYHTMDELYASRIELWIALCRAQHVIYGEFGRQADFDAVWRSKLHSDGSEYTGWFLLGIRKEQGRQMTYHVPIARWDDCKFARILEKAPTFDGHTPADVLERLKKL